MLRVAISHANTFSSPFFNSLFFCLSFLFTDKKLFSEAKVYKFWNLSLSFPISCLHFVPSFNYILTVIITLITVSHNLMKCLIIIIIMKYGRSLIRLVWHTHTHTHSRSNNLLPFEIEHFLEYLSTIQNFLSESLPSHINFFGNSQQLCLFNFTYIDTRNKNKYKKKWRVLPDFTKIEVDFLNCSIYFFESSVLICMSWSNSWNVCKGLNPIKCYSSV